VLPFGYVAHDQAADPAAPLKTAVTVSAAGVVREIAVSWGSGASAWTWTVAYSRLGATPAPAAPADARPLRDRLHGDKQVPDGAGRRQVGTHTRGGRGRCYRPPMTVETARAGCAYIAPTLFVELAGIQLSEQRLDRVEWRVGLFEAALGFTHEVQCGCDARALRTTGVGDDGPPVRD
jgi:hypothetical protein